MKKLLRGLCLAISIALIGFALVGCGGGGGSSSNPPSGDGYKVEGYIKVDDSLLSSNARAALKPVKATVKISELCQVGHYIYETTEDGYYVFNNVPEGHYNICATANDNADLCITVPITVEGNTNVPDAQLEKGQKYTVNLVDKKSQKLNADAEIFMLGVSYGAGKSFASFETKAISKNVKSADAKVKINGKEYKETLAIDNSKTVLTLTVTGYENSSEPPTPPVEGDFAGGKGTADDPYLINTAEQLKAISTNEDTLKACYKLNADITLTGEWEPIGGSSAETQTYRGDSTAYDKKFFSGSLDGNGKTISGLTINKSGDDYVGMFRATKSASFRNINLVNVNVTGKNCVGALVAFVKPSNDKSLVIENCQVSGRVNANCNVGGLVGESQGYNILNTNTKIRVDYTSCKSSAIVTGTSKGNHGGLVGTSVFSKYTNCEFSGTVTGIGYVGGISGFGTGVGDTYESCVCSGNVNGSASDNFAYAVGGITSSSNGVTFTKCTVTATITANGHTWVGALAFCDDPERITINNCDVTGAKIIKK